MQENKEFVQATARISNCRMSARKMRLVAHIIRGSADKPMQVDKAFGILKFTKNEGARWLEKMLASAVANWRVLTGEEPDEYGMVIKLVWVDTAPLLKRFRPAPHGRAHRIHKHSCHASLVIVNTKNLVNETASVENQVNQTV